VQALQGLPQARNDDIKGVLYLPISLSFQKQPLLDMPVNKLIRFRKNGDVDLETSLCTGMEEWELPFGLGKGRVNKTTECLLD